MKHELSEIFDSKLFKALSEPVRVDILRVLADQGSMDIGQIAAHMPQDRSVISRHLTALHEVGFLTAEKRGRHIIYAIDGIELLQRLEGMAFSLRRYFEACCPDLLNKTGDS